MSLSSAPAPLSRGRTGRVAHARRWTTRTTRTAPRRRRGRGASRARADATPRRPDPHARSSRDAFSRSLTRPVPTPALPRLASQPPPRVRGPVSRRRGHAVPLERVHHRARVLRRALRGPPHAPRLGHVVGVRVRRELHVRQRPRARGARARRRRLQASARAPRPGPPVPVRGALGARRVRDAAPRPQRRRDDGVQRRRARRRGRAHRARAGRKLRRRQLSSPGVQPGAHERPGPRGRHERARRAPHDRGERRVPGR